MKYFKKKNVKTFKRAVLFYYNRSINIFEIWNYYIKHSYTDINKNIKKIVNSNKIPDFSNLNDVSELFLKN